MANGSLETVVTEVFREILNRASLQPDDDFFLAGGDSLLATDAVIKLSEITGSEIEMALMFTSPTARELATAITTSADADGNGGYLG